MSPGVVLLGTGGTLLLFLLMRRVSRALGGHPLANAVALTAGALITGGNALGVAPGVLAAAAWPLMWAMGPAIVALAGPIRLGWAGFAGRRAALLGTVAGGSLVGVATAVGAARALGLPPLLEAALSTKSATSPFAFVIQGALGGPAALAAGASVATGIVGAMLLPPLLRRAGLGDHRTLGLAVGQAAHIVGTDALRAEPEAARASGLALALAGPFTALWVLAWAWARG